MPRGYHRAFYILRFGHRGSFKSRLFGWMPPLSAAQAAEIAVAPD
jgi:TctA family transporter